MSITILAVVVLVISGGPFSGTANVSLPLCHSCPAGDGAGGPVSLDIDGNNQVDLGDFVIFGNCYPSAPKPYSAGCDFDCNGLVDLADFAEFAIHYGH